MIDYTVVEFDDEEHYEIQGAKVSLEGDIEDIAEVAARDFFENRNGWEAEWPLTFSLYQKGKEEIGRYKVELEQEPVFSASKVKSFP